MNPANSAKAIPANEVKNQEFDPVYCIVSFLYNFHFLNFFVPTIGIIKIDLSRIFRLKDIPPPRCPTPKRS